MDLLNIIMGSEKSTCFLCFSQKKNVSNIYDAIEIQDESTSASVCVFKMWKFLFPTHETVLSHCCDECSNIVTKMFIVLRRNIRRNLLLSKLVDLINEKVMKLSFNSKQKTGTVTIDISPENNNLKGKSVENNMIERYNNINRVIKDYSSHKIEVIESKVVASEQKAFKLQNKARICDVCGKFFKTTAALKAHLNCHRKKECPYCQKILKTHSHYNYHVKRHKTSIKRVRKRNYFNCNECPYYSVNKSTLEAHINKNHLYVRPYVCQTCTKAFYKKSHLTEHILTHKKITTVTCEYCGEGFVSKKTLLIHLKLHSNEKLFQCDLCDKKFVTSGHRLEHFKRTHLQKTECCMLCDKKYSLKKDLNRHIKNVHSVH